MDIAVKNGTVELVICMGSACFARGNTQNVEVVRTYLKQRGLSQLVKVTGTLCQNQCRQGPNITLNGECFCGVDPETLPDILDEKLASLLH